MTFPQGLVPSLQKMEISCMSWPSSVVMETVRSSSCDFRKTKLTLVSVMMFGINVDKTNKFRLILFLILSTTSEVLKTDFSALKNKKQHSRSKKTSKSVKHNTEVLKVLIFNKEMRSQINHLSK